MTALIDPMPASPTLVKAQSKNGYDLDIHPGWGLVTLCRNGVEHRRDDTGEHGLTWYDALIQKDAFPHRPTPVWTLHIDGPLRSLIYALTPEHGWALIDTKDGFA